MAGDQHATIVEVGGGIGTYRAGDRDVCSRIPSSSVRWHARRPADTWPDRLADGRYSFDDTVDGTSFDFRTPRKLGDLPIDYAFTDLERDEAGRAWVRLGRPDGHTAELWVDETFPIIELYTGDILSPNRRRRGLGTGPMSCPPNAFQTGQHVIRLEPGQSATTVSCRALGVSLSWSHKWRSGGLAPRAQRREKEACSSPSAPSRATSVLAAASWQRDQAACHPVADRLCPTNS